MNERINNLFGQALDEAVPETWTTLDADQLSRLKEKFAELIVTECINIVKPTQHHEAFAQGYLGDIDGLELLDGKVKQIKQHFGVEQ